MTIQEWLQQCTNILTEADIPTARLDCLVLLEDVTGLGRAHLLAHPTDPLTQPQLDWLEELVLQRAKHTPLAYVRGKTEFYGREFAITSAVLEPRPESETMIDLLKKLQPEAGAVIVDVGTGSGALGITAALELPETEVVLVDIDKDALRVAENNCDRYELDLSCVADDLLAHAAKRGVQIDIVLANLPYVPDDYHINTAALHEPAIAIFGGPDGLDLYRKLFSQLAQLKQPPQYVLTESLPFQHEDLKKIATSHGYEQQTEEDFIQLFTASS